MSKSVRFKWLALGLTGLLVSTSTTSAATIQATSPNLLQIAPPASVMEGALEDDINAVIFRERANFVLPQNLSVDATNVGTTIFPDGSGGVPGIIPAGTPVDSFYIHYDPLGQQQVIETVQWALAFQPADTILGLIYSDSRLDASDFLGSGTLYPNGVQFRGTTGALEGPDDIMFLTPSDVSSTQTATVVVDHIRVILAVPEPAAGVLTLCLTAICSITRWRGGLPTG